MPKEQYFSQEQLQFFKDALEEMEAQPPQRLNRRDVITLLAEKINALREKGYSLEEIADKLREVGFKISMLTLKRYLLPGNLEQRRAKMGTLTPKETKKAHKTRKDSPSATKQAALFETGKTNSVEAGETLPPTNQEPSLENGKTNSVDAVETDEVPPIEIQRCNPPATKDETKRATRSETPKTPSFSLNPSPSGENPSASGEQGSLSKTDQTPSIKTGETDQVTPIEIQRYKPPATKDETKRATKTKTRKTPSVGSNPSTSVETN